MQDGATAPTYELLQRRLSGAARRLRQAAETLNDQRSEAFAPVPLVLAEQERVPTLVPCTPRDAVGLGDLLLLAANTPPGVAQHRRTEDLLQLYRVDRHGTADWTFTAVAPEGPENILADPSFRRDFDELLTYYSETRLVRLVLTEAELLMVVGIGSADTDVRVLRWRRSGRQLTYIDAYGQDDLGFNNRFDFAWAETGRDCLVEGRWPHLVVAETLYIGTTRGELDIRIDDAVTEGRTVLREPLAEAAQDVGEMRVRFARLGDLIALRIMAYREPAERFYLYNRLTRALQRVDALGRGCHQLPEGQGVVFPGGFHLQNGETRVFATDASGFELAGAHRSPNGEDFLYVYHRPADGQYLLLSYNLLTRAMDVPLACCGYALFEDGTLVAVRDAPEPQRLHTLSIYTSPFCAADRYVSGVPSDSFFGRVGNTELVHALGECLSIARDAERPDFNAAVFEALVARTTRLVDTNAWFGQDEARGLGELLVEVRLAAVAVLDEFAAMAAAKRDAAALVTAADRDATDYVTAVGLGASTVEDFLDLLDRGRLLLGRLASLTEVREIDRDALDALAVRVRSAFEALAGQTLVFLQDASALAVIRDAIDQVEAAGRECTKAALLDDVVADLERSGQRLVLLTDVVGGLDVADATVKTNVLRALAELLARRNSVRAALDAHGAQLRESETAASFGAALAVLGQRATAGLLGASDASAVDAVHTELEAELENLALRFGDVTAHADALDAKRAEMAEVFGRRREALATTRARRIDNLVASAQRGLATVAERAGALADRAGVDTFFATNALVARARRTIAELTELGEAGRASELDVALRAAHDQARRTAGDRAELFEAGTVRIGGHRFGVNTERFALRLDAADGRFVVKLAGTDLAVALDGERELAGHVDLAAQSYPTETDHLPRALYLALEAHRLGEPGEPGKPDEPSTRGERGTRGPAHLVETTNGGGDLREALTRLATGRLEDGYELGVHDVDAARILEAIAPVLGAPGLRFDGAVRAVAASWLAASTSAEVSRELHALRALGGRPGRSRDAFVADHGAALGQLARGAGLDVDLDVVVDALLEGHFPATADPAPLVGWAHAAALDLRASTFAERVRWATDLGLDDPAQVAWLAVDRATPAAMPTTVVVEGLRSRHPLIRDGKLLVDVPRASTEFLTYRNRVLPRFAAFAVARRSVLARWGRELDVERLRPKVLSSFVRNRLVDEVLLPLVGANLARQLGISGASQGLLLLVSPPGYGKTTLVDYVADLLGFALVKVSGPALGQGVTSLDPAAAPDSTAAAELVKLNRAFAMGTNVVCYLDDIQHTSPELLQRFIPLCDGTRRIEGVVEGRPTTFDLSGKRFVMVMAGNPYTGGGGHFQVPDMLANRADVHNLGDIVAGNVDAFAQSYLENAAGHNPTLAPVLARGRDQLDLLLRAVAAGEGPPAHAFHAAASPAELANAVRVVQHLGRVRDLLLAVNGAYVAAASLPDALRGEPPFLLQGSYRNLARIAPHIVAAMTPPEVDAVVAEHYHAEAQTLASAAAWNLAKLAEVAGWATDTDRARLTELRARWQEFNVGTEPLAVMASALRGIESSLHDATGPAGRTLPS